MKDKNQDLTSIEPLMTIEEVLETIDIMLESINLSDNTVKTSDSFFTTFYNTVAYYFNYALETVTNYFYEDPMEGSLYYYTKNYPSCSAEEYRPMDMETAKALGLVWRISCRSQDLIFQTL